MKCRQCRDLFFSYQERSLAQPELGKLEEHLRACPSCAAAFQDWEKSGALFAGSSGTVPAPDWERSWQRIDAAVAPGASRRRRHAAWLFFPRWAFVAGGFLVFFILGMVFARLGFFPAKSQAPGAPEPAFLYSAGDYFAALQPVMASYANAPASRQGDPEDQARARLLLNDLYLLKLRAARSRDSSLQQLLGDIELILLEIAHLDRSDPRRVRQVGDMIQEKGIALKMRVYKPAERRSVRI